MRIKKVRISIFGLVLSTILLLVGFARSSQAAPGGQTAKESSPLVPASPTTVTTVGIPNVTSVSQAPPAYTGVTYGGYPPCSAVSTASTATTGTALPGGVTIMSGGTGNPCFVVNPTVPTTAAPAAAAPPAMPAIPGLGAAPGVASNNPNNTTANNTGSGTSPTTSSGGSGATTPTSSTTAPAAGKTADAKSSTCGTDTSAAQQAYKSCQPQGATSNSQTLIVDEKAKKAWVIGSGASPGCFTATPDANGPVGNFSTPGSTSPAPAGGPSITPAPINATSTKGSSTLSIYEQGGYAANAASPTTIPSGGIAIQKGKLDSLRKVTAVFVWDGKTPANCGDSGSPSKPATPPNPWHGVTQYSPFQIQLIANSSSN